MDLFEFIERIEILPDESESGRASSPPDLDKSRESELIRQLDLRDVDPPKLSRALAASVRRHRIHPAPLDAYYCASFLDLYARSVRTSFARDAIVHHLVQSAAYRLWPWGDSSAREVFVQVGGLEDLGFVCATVDNGRVPSLLVPWKRHSDDSEDAGRLREIEKLGRELNRAMSHAANEALPQIDLENRIGVLVLANPPSVDCARRLLEAMRTQLSPDLDLVIYGGDSTVQDIVTRCGLEAHPNRSRNFRAESASGDVGAGVERVFVMRRRSVGSQTIRARSRYPAGSAARVQSGSDHILRVSPERRVPSRKPVRILGRGPGTPADAAFFREHHYLVDDFIDLPAAEYAVLHDCDVGAFGMVIDRRGHWVEDLAAPYHRGRIADFRANPSGVMGTTEVPGVSSVVTSGGSAHSHWLVEGLMRLWPYPALGLRPRLILPTPLKGYQRRMFELAGFPGENLLPARPDHLYHCEKLVSWVFGIGHQIEVVEFIDALCNAAGEDAEPRPERIFVPRVDVEGYRKCMNEELLIQGMIERGFTIVIPGQLGAEEEIRVFRAACVIVGPLGAGLANSIFSRPGATIVAYSARSYMEPHLQQIAQLLEHDVTYYLSEEFESRDVDPASGTRNSNYVLDIPEFLELLDQTLGEL